MPDFTLAHPDGRIISYAEYGNPSGVPVIFCHGTPGSRLDYDDSSPLCSHAWVRLIVPERAGYGYASPQPGRTLLRWAEDVRFLADALEIESFVCAGSSGGGPHALACAHALPDRVSQVHLFASPCPTDGRAPLSGMTANRLGLWLSGFAWGRKFVRCMISRNTDIARDRPEAFVSLILRQLSKPDQELLRSDEAKQGFKATLMEAYRHGPAGHLADAEIILTKRPWGFDLGGIQTPATIWQGGKDNLVSPAMADVLHTLLPNAQVIRYPEAGHLLVEREDIAARFAEMIRPATTP